MIDVPITKVTNEYLAGYFDGNGSVYLTSVDTPWPQLRITINGRTLEEAEFIHDIFGVGTRRQRQINIAAKDDVRDFLSRMHGRVIFKAQIVEAAVRFTKQQDENDKLRAESTTHPGDVQAAIAVTKGVRKLLDIADEVRQLTKGFQNRNVKAQKAG
jgi:hypothetical protein